MEHLLTLFFATFSAAFMATVPPGLLNMNAAKISVEKGKTNGIIFSLGVSTMIIIQAYISVLISKFLFKNPEKNSFFKGILLAALNLLTIPYYSGLNAMWNASGWIQFQFRDIATFILAAGCGTFTVLYLYTVYFTKLETKNNGFSKNSNYILSALMMLLLVITLIRIFYT